MWFTRISIANPVFATMMMAALVVLGLFSYQRMRVDQFPDINFPVVVVQTEYPGASPENVEAEVSRKVEEAVNTISGIKTISSRSFEGVSIVVVEFDLSIDPAVAAQDVREKVAVVKVAFRREIKEPKITRFDPSDRPVISLGVSSPSMDLKGLTTLSDQLIKKRLENARGVGSVALIGGAKREVQIYLKPAEMEALAVGADQVINALRSENQDLPAGAIRSRESERVVQIPARFKKAEDFGTVIVGRRGAAGASQPVFLREIASIVDGQEEQENLALYNGERTLAVDILKAQGQNTIDVVDAVREALKRLQPELPRDVKIEVLKDGSKSIRTGVDNVRRTIFEGAALTVLIVFLFLNSWRSTVITGLTLPIALIGTFLFMYLAGLTINMISLMALSLSVGLLIDDAIVVRENIVRHTAMGKDHRAAALEGTREIGVAVMATTFSIVAVFLPIGFMGGIIGRFMQSLGLTVVVAVLISMFVSFTLDPMLSSVWPDPPKRPGSLYQRSIGRVLDAFERLVGHVSRFYRAMLVWALRHRAVTVLAAALISFGSFALVPYLGAEFVPQADYSETVVTFKTPVGSSLEVTEAKARQVDAALREFPEILYTYTTINTGSGAGKHLASTYIKLKDRKDRELNQAALTQPIRERLARIAGVTLTNVGSINPVSGQKILVLSLQGPDLKVLEQLSAEVSARLASVPGLVDLDSSLSAPKPTIDVRLKREVASDVGIGVNQVGNALRPLLAGEAATNWRAPDGEYYDVKVRLAPADRNTVADLNRIMLASSRLNADGSPQIVALRQVADLVPATAAQQVNRKDLTREVQIDAGVYRRSAGDVSADVKAMLDTMQWPPGYRYVFGGSTKDMQESAGFAGSALLLAVIFIYMILASQFGSFMQPVAIMSSLPLTMIGVFGALLIFRSTLNLFSVIGIIMLMGLVTKNAILLIDFVNHARAAGMAREEAILEAARVRLRPILMTTLAMIFGMLPLSLGLGEGSEQRAPMGQAVIGGVITSSVLTLVVVPIIYTLLDDLIGLFRRRTPVAAGAGVLHAAQCKGDDKI